MDEQERMKLLSFPEADAQNARVARGSGNSHAAKTFWDMAIAKVNDTNPVYRFERAICFLKIKQPEKALEDCERSLELNHQDSGNVYYAMTLCYLDLPGDVALMNAVLYCEKALALHPDEYNYQNLWKIVEEKVSLSKVKIAPEDDPPPEHEKVVEFLPKLKQTH